MKNLFFIILFTTFAYAKDVKLPSHLQKFLQSHPNIVLGTNSEWDPYVIVKEDGSISDYDNDILELVNHYTGTYFSLKAGVWSEIQHEEKEKKIEDLSTLTSNAKRKKWLLFSPSYITIQKTILTNVENSLEELESVESLRGKTRYQAVIDGKYPFCFGNSTTEYQLGKMGLAHLKTVYTFKKAINLRFAIRKDLIEAMEILKIGLSRISYEEFQKVEKRWFYKNTTFNKWFLTSTEKKYLKNKKQLVAFEPPRDMRNGFDLGLRSL